MSFINLKLKKDLSTLTGILIKPIKFGHQKFYRVNFM